ncbi:hypothetical protein EB796_002107 [Bugula neritina]|uniref:Uncharacterized protein n=1 Tax=Bugula neritina TaxID=10212 RepID=A0A7J7KN43_BUGNE|nr:hypothetical protein EB796_002107 [Bugula neritina]
MEQNIDEVIVVSTGGYSAFADDECEVMQEEKLVADHIRALDNCFHGLSKDKCRMLAFDYAKANNISTPANWIKDGMAGKRPHRILRSFTLIQL